MEYKQINIALKPLEPWSDIFISALADEGYDSFEETPNGFKAFVQKDLFKEEVVSALKEQYQNEVELSYSVEDLPDVNWNANWESSFSPIEVGDWCVVKAPFHTIAKKFKYEIIIEPKMSFGTGHHQTTFLMMQEMKDIDWQNKRVLDMGSGTGILAILAEKMGTKDIVAIDIDEWAYENCVENLEKNNCSHIEVLKGDVTAIDNKGFDIILANINRNILLADMEAYVKSLRKNGLLFMSGFLLQDVEVLKEKIASLGLVFDKLVTSGEESASPNFSGNWVLIKCKK
jgi:ribosomal protein L11 methyltransferase